MSRLQDMRNLGPVSEEWLCQAGITSVEELSAVGAVAAYRKVVALGVKPSLNLLYAIDGALLDVPWNHLPAGERERLLMEVDALEDWRALLDNGSSAD